MPRAIWSGTISFGLVNIPVRMYSAIQEQKLHFHFMHRKDDSPIGYDKVCKKEDKSVPDKEIGKSFEVSKGEYVYLEDEDFEAAPADEEEAETPDLMEALKASIGATKRKRTASRPRKRQRQASS